MEDLVLYAILLFSNTFILLPVILTTVVISVVFAAAVKFIARISHAGVTHRVDDRAAVYACENLHGRSYINVIFHLICKGTITVDELRSQVETKLLSWDEEPEKRRKFWRLKERVTTFLGFLFWEPIPNFDIAQHVRLYDLDQPDLRLPPVVTDEDLTRISSAYVGYPYQKGCPWEMLLIPNYLNPDQGDSKEKKQQHCVILLRFHHALMDASGVNEFLEYLFDNNDKEKLAMAARLNRFPVYSPVQKLIYTVSIALRIPFNLATVALAIVKGQNEWFSVSKTHAQDYHTYYSEPIPLSTLEKVRKLYGVNYTAIVHALTTGVILRMMKENGQKIGDSISFLCPYPLEGHPGGITNHFTLEVFSFNPELNMAVKSRLLSIAKLVKPVHISDSIFPIFYNWLNQCMAQMPYKLIQFVDLLFKSTAALTYAPGPSKELEIKGKIKLLDILPTIGCPKSSCGSLSVAYSYNGKFRVGFNVDRHNMPKGPGAADRVTTCLNEQLNELLKQS